MPKIIFGISQKGNHKEVLFHILKKDIRNN